MKINVCIGSSCHLKGSRVIVEMFQDRLKNDNLTEMIELSGSFCLGKCNSQGVSIKVDDEIICGVTKDNFNEIYGKYVSKEG
ncbi:MAG: NAD(P)H-dependent oxidoreductase subunit E [Oscillospiraceae bacterium]|nr:NAD(P)H-dependent oxidoreductase subunit E [Oscillospiraceae bacterium]